MLFVLGFSGWIQCLAIRDYLVKGHGFRFGLNV